jgi:hypothetical protein
MTPPDSVVDAQIWLYSHTYHHRVLLVHGHSRPCTAHMWSLFGTIRVWRHDRKQVMPVVTLKSNDIG